MMKETSYLFFVNRSTFCANELHIEENPRKIFCDGVGLKEKLGIFFYFQEWLPSHLTDLKIFYGFPRGKYCLSINESKTQTFSSHDIQNK